MRSGRPWMPRASRAVGSGPGRQAGWPAIATALSCDHAGLLLLFPAIAQLGLNDLVRQASVITRVPGSTCSVRKGHSEAAEPSRRIAVPGPAESSRFPHLDSDAYQGLLALGPWLPA